MPELSVKKHRSGIIIDYDNERLTLDTGLPDEPALLSHAHADHMSGVNLAACVFSTGLTFDVVDARNNLTFRAREVIEYESTFNVRNIRVTAYDAGHVLGSAMFLMEFPDGLRVLYTGDFNVVDSLVHQAAHPIESDVLIMETTYGTPDWIFPERTVTHSNIVQAANEETENGRIPVFKAYSLGKAQEAIYLLQNKGFNVISGNHVIDSVSSLYSKASHNLKFISSKSRHLADFVDEKAVIISSSPKHTRLNLRRRLPKDKVTELESRMEEYSLSGWTLGKYSERGYPLSAHSDFQGLASFVTGVNPKIVYCFTDNAIPFSGYLVGTGVNAVPLE